VFADDRLPSRTRRIVVIIAYILGSFALFLVSMILLLQTVISNQCSLYARCSRWENLMIGLPVLGWIAVCLVCAGLGWRGRLFGCRAR
jgi:H+/Cl- antiporter ClcA